MEDDNFTDPAGEPEVTERDRNAARALWEECFATTFHHEETLGSPHIAAKFKDAFANHRQEAAEYWYRQGRDDGGQWERDVIVNWLRETWRTDMGIIECLDIADAIEAGEHLK